MFKIILIIAIILAAAWIFKEVLWPTFVWLLKLIWPLLLVAIIVGIIFVVGFVGTAAWAGLSNESYDTENHRDQNVQMWDPNTNSEKPSSNDVVIGGGSTLQETITIGKQKVLDAYNTTAIPKEQ